MIVANTPALAKDDLANGAGLALSIGEDPFKRAPVRVAYPLAWWQPDAVIGTNGHDKLEMQFFQFTDKLAAFAIQASLVAPPQTESPTAAIPG